MMARKLLQLLIHYKIQITVTDNSIVPNTDYCYSVFATSESNYSSDGTTRLTGTNGDNGRTIEAIISPTPTPNITLTPSVTVSPTPTTTNQNTSTTPIPSISPQPSEELEPTVTPEITVSPTQSFLPSTPSPTNISQ